MIDPARFKHKELRNLFEGRRSRVDARWRRKIERALAHKDRDQIRAAYHRGLHWDERVAMAQWWSDHLDMPKAPAQVIPLRKAK